MVQPKAEIDERFEQQRLGGVARWPLSLALLGATTFATVFLSRVSLGPSEIDASFEHAVPLLGGLTIILGASEVGFKSFEFIAVLTDGSQSCSIIKHVASALVSLFALATFRPSEVSASFVNMLFRS